MIDKLTPQQRLLLAVALSFVFFVAYEYFMISKYPPKKDLNQTQVATQVANVSAPTTNTSTQAPNSLPSNTSNATKDVEYIVHVKSKHYDIKIDKLGRIYKYYLNDKKFIGEDGERVQLVESKFSPKPLEVRFSDQNTNNEAFTVAYTSDKSELNLEDDKPQSVILTQKLTDTTITKKLTFYPKGNYEINLHVSNPKEYFVSPGARPNAAVDGYTFHGILVQEADDTLKVIDDGDTSVTENFVAAPFIAAADKYYATLFYNYKGGLNAVVTKGENDIDIVFAKGSSDMSFSGYIGPKDHKVLKEINPELLNVIEYGWFTFIAKPVFTLLAFLFGMIGNWGWAIVAMTLLIRVVLFPLTYKGMVSMNKLKELSPKIKELQAKYKGEPQKLNAHMMELYKKHGANPMGGCLPILLQIPVFFAIYRVLQNAVELKDAPWVLWIQDLSVMDPYYVLPIIMGITMFLHQRLTPTNFTDPMQEKIMKYLPLIFTFFFITFPAGLTLYWVTNNIFSILQQLYVNSIFAKKKQKA